MLLIIRFPIFGKNYPLKKPVITGNYKTLAKYIQCTFVTGLLFSLNTYAQQPASTDTNGRAYTEALAKSYPQQNELFLLGLKSSITDKKLLKHYEANYKEIFEVVNEQIKEGQMIYNPVLSVTLEKLLQEIKTKNPVVAGDIRIMLMRENYPNAYTLGDASIFVNMGLLYHLDNEDQAAGVLSHEIGHLLMTHTLKALKDNYDRDKENIANVKEVKQTEVKKTDRAFNLLKNSVYKKGRLQREHELEADSIGYVLFKTLGYRKAAFAEALEIVDRNDTLVPGVVATETYKLFFDLPNQKFEEKWLKGEDFSSYNYKAYTEKYNKDSISSHPKSKERVAYLTKVFPELALKENNTPTGISASYAPIKTLAEKERFSNLYFNEKYGEVIYLSLLYLQKEPGDKHYKSWLGKGLQKIYEARRDYKLNKYLDRVSPKDQSESYQRFLGFMWNLSLNEMKNMADFYAAK